MKIIITKTGLKKHETEKIMKMIYASFLAHNHNNSNEKLRKKMEKLYGPNINISLARKRLLLSEILLIAKINKHIVGVIRGKKNFIKNLYIKSDMLRLGIGSRLLKSFEKTAKNRGSKKILLKSSKYAQPFHKQQGFVQRLGKFLEKNI